MLQRPLLPLAYAGIALASVFIAGYDLRLGGGRQNLAAAVLSSLSGTGTSTSAVSAPTLADALQQLEEQERFLGSEIATLRSQLEITDLKTVFTRTLKRGDSGDDVSKLQELLGNVPDAYPPETDASTSVSGYYGHITEAAVKKFQDEEGLKQTGVVDKDTREKLYALAASIIDDENGATEFTPIDFSAIPDLQNPTNFQEQISDLASTVSSTQANLADVQNQLSQITSDIADLQAGAASSQAAPLPTSPVSAAPAVQLIISSINQSVTQTSATITWTTNAPAGSEIDYSMSSGLTPGQTFTVSSATLATSHSLTLPHLTASTKYYYRAISKDNTGGAASTGISSFTTLK